MSDRDEQADGWELAARYLAGECTSAEAEAFERWLGEDPGRARELELLRTALGRLAFGPPADLDTEAALARVHERMDRDQVSPIEAAPSRARSRPSWYLPLQVAAALALLLGAATLYRELGNRPGTTPPALAARTWETPQGRADTIPLADGSTVVLAPSSRLVVAAGYGESERAVELAGMAWFEVRHDRRRPFLVRAGDALVTDLGTAFTVRADPAEPVRVAVSSGSVRLAANDAAAAGVILRAGQSGTLAGGVVALDTVGAGVGDLAWAGGPLVFREAPFARVAAELRRWHGVVLVAGDAVIAGRHLTSEFEGEAVTDMISVIALALDARIELRGDTVVLHSRP